MPNSQKQTQKPEKRLDSSLGKRGRGRPATIPRSWVIGRAENYRGMFAQVCPGLAAPLLEAETEEQVNAAFEKHGQPYNVEFVPRLTSDILALVRSPNFPTRSKARIAFLADSLAGRPTITARTSRDICSKERAKQRAKSPHKIIRHEFYVECECGYKGPARDNACQNCGAPIVMDLNILWANPAWLS
jgi:hypothetical protein